MARWPDASTRQQGPKINCPATTVPEPSGLGLASSATSQPTQSHGMNEQKRWSHLSSREEKRDLYQSDELTPSLLSETRV